MNLSSSNKKEYPINLTIEEMEAIPMLIEMAMVYTWDLYEKTEDDKFYIKHKEIIDKIKDFHINHQGLLAVGSYIECKVNKQMKDIELNKILNPFIDKTNNRYTTVWLKKEVKIKNHIGYFTDDYIDMLSLVYDDIQKEKRIYNVIPIGDKFSIPYIKNGIVEVMYCKKIRTTTYTINTEDVPIDMEE